MTTRLATFKSTYASRVCEAITNGDAFEIDNWSTGLDDGVRNRWHILACVTL